MADPFDHDPVTPQGGRAKDELHARFDDLRRDAASSARSAAESVSDRYDSATSGGARADASLGDRTAKEGKGSASSIADQARARLTEIVAQQKAAGADRIAGVAHAAHAAADNLSDANPQMARAVRSVAESVDRVASDVRSREIGDVLATVADFGRRQPVAFFSGAVLAGFVLSRFFKSDLPVVDEASIRFGGRSV